MTSVLPSAGSARAREAIAWLETLGPNKTLIESPNETIVPTIARPSTAGAHAMAMLEELVRDARKGTQLEVGGVIAEGGMGVIREARQVALGRTVAVKSLKPARREPGAALDLLREAWVTGGLEHPSIVPVHAIELDDEGMPSIVLKRVAGVEWSHLLANAAEVQRRFGAVDLHAWNLDVFLRVLDALRFAHSHGVLHRDLKPSNVMIGDFGEVYLLDWGLAVSMRDDGSGRLPLAVHATELAGTPCYMAPEMLGREYGPPLGEHTDVYLAGAVLFEIVVGTPPHTGKTAVDVIAKVITSRPEVPAHVNPELARICERAMQLDPAARFESIETMQVALRRYLEHRGSAQLADRAKERLARLLAALAPVTAASEATTGRHREDIYRLFGACRYGFRDALAVWPDNTEARLGLAQATVALAEYELAAERPQAAVTLLGELEEPPPLLATARAAATAQALRVAELEQLGRQHDQAIGRRTRAFLTLMLGVVFVVFPLLMHHVAALQGMVADPAAHVWFAVAMTGVGVLTTWWARESMGATLVNRRLMRGLVFMFAMQGVLAAGGWNLGFSIDQMLATNLFLYAVTTGMCSVWIESWLWISTVGYIVAFFAATARPDQSLLVLTAANLLFTANALWRWWPEQVRFTDDERAARGLPPRQAR